MYRQKLGRFGASPCWYSRPVRPTSLQILTVFWSNYSSLASCLLAITIWLFQSSVNLLSSFGLTTSRLVIVRAWLAADIEQVLHAHVRAALGCTPKPHRIYFIWWMMEGCFSVGMRWCFPKRKWGILRSKDDHVSWPIQKLINNARGYWQCLDSVHL